ncbi:fatty-acid amide hydrolase 2-A isoform X2 [Plutella xylostella]|uniref:fatty-acid amide hydrolase 2-A isoform X1 n=1 Tax=Plutella xylostella TaxID=51655 RepID=UPI002032AE35|nr:fatty-acid amide hydrolase 2-A isoform X1 [Plutella xylostella]XP_048478588.1 fatty-acid amide hydrolase 2-A isoform X2 [Plutella xylostella]
MACHAMKAFLVILRTILDRIIDFAFSLVWEGQKAFRIPDLDKKHAILAESATSLAAKIKKGQLKSEDLVQAVIERIKAVNPVINAIADERYTAALEEARDVDRRVAAGLSAEDLAKPFLGVPFTTKESQTVAGLRNTLGLWSRREVRATQDSEAVRRLRAAGAFPVAATNLPELLLWQETRNNVYGQTNNPHHAGRTAGGSSGAEAALTASYATPISLCSDLGGSTRMPAFYCGMFGHHPTANTTNLKGILRREGEEESMFALGFISKHVEDLAPLQKVIAGPKAPLLKLDRHVDVKDIKFFYLESSDDCHVSSIRPELRSAMTRVVSKLSSSVPTSNAPEPYSHPGFSHMYQLWNYWMTKEPETFAQMFTDWQGEAKWCTELAKKLFCMSNHCLSAVVRLAETQVMPTADPQWAEQISKELKEDLFTKLGTNGVLLFPSAPHAAPYHYSAFLRPYNFAYWAMVNALKCPATQVPLGVNSEGLPIGIQVLAAPYNDALCLSVAKYLEEQFGGAVMACKAN